MVESIVTTLAALAFIFAIYHYLGYRTEKRNWTKKVRNWYADGEKRQSYIVVIGDRFDKTELAKPMYENLRRANIPLTPSEFIGALIVATMGMTIMFQNVFAIKFPMNVVFAIILIEISRRLLFFLRRNKLKQRISEQLPEVCKTLANATRSGMTLTQGVHLVAQEISEPAKTEFKRLANEISLGVDFTTALKHMEKRIESREFKLFVATLLIQKKAGGNLFAVLDEMANTLEERKLLLQEIKTMTAEQRYVSYVVPVIPAFLVLMMNNVIDGFLDPLFSGIGLILLGLFSIGTLFTFILVRKVTNIRV